MIDPQETAETLRLRVCEYLLAATLMMRLAVSSQDKQAESTLTLIANELKDTAMMWQERLEDL